MKRWLNTIIEGDCLQVMADFPAGSIDMVLCDLPYGQTRNPWDQRIDLDKLWLQYRRIIKDRGAIVLTSHGIFTGLLISSNPDWFRYKIVWIKSKATNFLNAKKQPLRKHEDVCIFYKKQGCYQPQMTPGKAYSLYRKPHKTGSYNVFDAAVTINKGERYPVDVVHIPPGKYDADCFHPNQKSVELGRYLVRTFTRPGEIVLDNACGSGSFPLAALLEGRRFIGIEKNQHSYLRKTQPADFVDIARKRIKEVKTINQNI